MEASAGLVAGSHNRNELVVIHGHEEPKALKNLDGQVCEICGDEVGLTVDGDLFVACNECGFPVCRPCYEYERREGSQLCPQCKTRYKRLKDNKMNSNVPNVSTRTPKTMYDEASDVLEWAEKMHQEHEDSLPSLDLPLFCHAQVIYNELGKLKVIWEGLTPERRYNFSVKYGNIADLMYVSVNCFAIKALVDRWNPAYKCFTFQDFDLVPTIEEYQTLMGFQETTGNMIYCFNPKLTAKRTLSNFLNTRASELQNHVKIKGTEEFVSVDYLISLINGHISEEIDMTLLALCVYGTVLFPRAKGYVDSQVVKLFFSIKQGVDPTIPLLAETCRALNYCRVKEGGKLRCCASLLYIWMHSHFKFPEEFKCPKINFSISWNTDKNPISEFGTAKWDSNFPKEKDWDYFFSQAKQESVIWRAHWMPLKALIYRCGNFHTVPLLGPWGGVHYAPLLVLRQMWHKQFIPPTHELSKLQFSYDDKDFYEKRRHILASWKVVRKISSNDHCGGVTREYLRWHSHRGESIKRTANIEDEVKGCYQTFLSKPNRWALEHERRNQIFKTLQDEFNQKTEKTSQANKSSQEREKKKRLIEEDYDSIENENRRLLKENHALRTQNARLLERIRNQEEKSSRLFVEMDKIITGQKSQLAESEEANTLLRQSLDEIHKRMTEQLEEHTIQENYAKSIERQLQGYQRANEQLSYNYDQLEEECKTLKRDYDHVKNDLQGTLSKVNETLDTVRMMARRARGFALWARDLRDTTSPMASNADELYEFLGSIRRDLGYFGNFH